MMRHHFFPYEISNAKKSYGQIKERDFHIKYKSGCTLALAQTLTFHLFIYLLFWPLQLRN